MAGGYLVFILFSLIFVDADTNLHNRILLPFFTLALTAIAPALELVRRNGVNHPLRRWQWWGVVAFVLLFALRGVHSWSVVARQPELGFGSREWRQNEAVVAVRALPPGTLVVSNEHLVLGYFAGRRVQELPLKRLLTSHQPNETFAGEMATLATRLQASCGQVVVFPATLDADRASLEEIQHHLDLRLTRQMPTAVILRSAGGDCEPAGSD